MARRKKEGRKRKEGKKRKLSAWQLHVKEYARTHKGQHHGRGSLFKAAKATYHRKK